MWDQIVYPRPLSKNALIGVTAPSSGVPSILHPRLNLVLEHLEKRGFSYIEGSCLREDFKSVSGRAKARAKDFIELWNNPKVEAIIPPWGGELLVNILPYIDFESLNTESPKWILGYSDISTLLFSMTLATGISTAHGLNLMDSLIQQDDSLSSQTYEILSKEVGSTFIQKSSEKYQVKFEDFAKKVDATFNLTHETKWKTLSGKNNLSFSGRIIGGCIETLRSLVGTPYGEINKFQKKFKDDGLCIYLENAGSLPLDVCRSLWQMKLAGWFNNANGVIFGRSAGDDAKSEGQLSYKDALLDVFQDTDIPVIYDADIGHQPPQMTILNGSFAEVAYSSGSGSLIQTLY